MPTQRINKFSEERKQQSAELKRRQKEFSNDCRTLKYHSWCESGEAILSGFAELIGGIITIAFYSLCVWGFLSVFCPEGNSCPPQHETYYIILVGVK